MMRRILVALWVLVAVAHAASDEASLRRLRDRNQPLNQLLMLIDEKKTVEKLVLDALAAQAFGDESLQGPTTTETYAERKALLERLMREETLAQLAGTTMDDVRSAIQDAGDHPDAPSISMVDIGLAGIRYIQGGGAGTGAEAATGPPVPAPVTGGSTGGSSLLIALVILVTAGVGVGMYFLGMKSARGQPAPTVLVNPGPAFQSKETPQTTTIQRPRPEAPVAPAVPRAQQPTMPIMVDSLLEQGRPHRPPPPPPPSALSGSTPAVKPFGNLDEERKEGRALKYSGNLRPKSQGEDDTPASRSGSTNKMFAEIGDDTEDHKSGPDAGERSGATRRVPQDAIAAARGSTSPPAPPTAPTPEISLDLSEMVPRAVAPPAPKPATRVSTSAGGIQKMSISSFMPVAPDPPPSDANSEDVFPARYKNRSVLGRGGMGVVYRAVDSKSPDPENPVVVAIKTLTPQALESATARDRFHRECAAMLALDHPGIIKVHTVGQMPGRPPYIVMEFVEAQDIASMLCNATLPEDLVLDIGIQLASALGYAHEQGVLHRDLKPGNMLLTRKKQVKVVDFGLAKLEDSANITQAGTVLGSLRFMAPEQLLGEACDRRADIYGVGSSLYYMVSGVTPYEGQPPPSKLTKPAVPILSVFPGLNREFAAAIMKCLERDQKARYQTMAEFEADLRKIKL